MDTRGKTNAKFRNEVNEILARHKTNFDQLSFPKFNGNDPTGWIYEAKQYFEFKNITPEQEVQLASFHLEGIALQWHRWMTKFRGPLTWDEFTKAVQL
ncbi:hypothetical protein CK203_092398 [Vitis vinifera]|uniref:Retrotransposon gag domain-containing protein n=1 Tax=Vitis vinifera TaxID=29760 RepID=A0A438F1K5_VITVI|nr:hypothetical protein CK203_092398 [Vitis vinifera]